MESEKHKKPKETPDLKLCPQCLETFKPTGKKSKCPSCGNVELKDIVWDIKSYQGDKVILTGHILDE